MKKLTTLLAMVVFGALTFGGLAPAAATTLVLDRGEIGVFDVASDGGVPVLQVRDGTGLAADRVVAWEPSDVVIRVDGDAALTGDGGYRVGTDPVEGLPALSWNTELAAASGAESLSLEIGVDGPGDVAIETEDENGSAQLRFDSAQVDSVVLDVPAEEDTAWSFTEAGDYVLEVVPRLHTAEGVVTGPMAEYRIEVTEPSVEPAPEPSSAPAPEAAPAAEPEPAPQLRVDQPRAAASAPAAAPASRSDGTKIEPCFGIEVSEDAEEVSDGHFDFGVQVQDGDLISRVKDDRATPATWRPADELLFRLDETAEMEVPASPAFSFLGEPGETVWNIGQTQEPGVPWLGWNTQHETARAAIDGPTSWTLDEVEGPGELFIFQTGSFGNLIKVLGTADDWPKELSIPSNVHAHGNWSFTEPGAYKVTTTHAATLTSGETVTSTDTLTFLVGPCVDAPGQNLDEELLLTDDDLVEDNRNDVSVAPSTVEAGDEVTVSVPGAAEGDWLMPVVYSDPQQTSWARLDASGEITGVTTPDDLDEGDHKLAVYDAEGELVGWGPFTVEAADDPGNDDPGTDDPGTDDPGLDDPGSDDPGTDDPGAGDPGSDVPGGTGPGGIGGGSAPKAIDPCIAAGGTRGGSGGGADGDGDRSGTGGGSGGAAQTVSDGHFDFGPIIEDGALLPRVKDDRSQPPEWVDPSSRIFQLGAAAEMQVPDAEAYSFLGEPGDTVWMVPQTQIADVPWLGWNTQHETVRSEVAGPVTFTLDGVDGPGQLGVYLNDSFGGVGQKKFGDLDGFPSSFEVPLNVHEHGNWAFTEPGTYQVSMTLSATLNSGGQVSESATLTFQVGSGGTSGASAMDEGVTMPALMTVTLPMADTVSIADGDDAEGDKPKAGDAAKDGDKPKAESAPKASGGSDCVLPKAGAPENSGELLLLGILLAGSGAAVVASRRFVGAGR
ncbi:TIGR03773 family transporter-associated surface protein [Aeromicrobium sp. YIM 150415]|uniref:TIGR03773 family transporter-associated surface protein n=1 Tax=Aeromicrobium sp. YIM 150415 TaxID=2803912 RepID=UPI0019645672|nr:TIGR03773 family transporter-associated surface protein [Aeromicrobium sp. YIM 150415]MBM9463635.1 TIGR03773 family transporter-associated surface protein [Aeromicrobium sp. YIM 150415]